MPTAPLPSQVDAALHHPQPSMQDIGVLHAHLNNDPLALSWPTDARMHIRVLLEQLERAALQRDVLLKRAALQSGQAACSGEEMLRLAELRGAPGHRRAS